MTYLAMPNLRAIHRRRANRVGLSDTDHTVRMLLSGRVTSRPAPRSVSEQTHFSNVCYGIWHSDLE